jgi:hypothetical protein
VLFVPKPGRAKVKRSPSIVADRRGPLVRESGGPGTQYRVAGSPGPPLHRPGGHARTVVEPHCRE